jgi:hypothetical protein
VGGAHVSVQERRAAGGFSTRERLKIRTGIEPSRLCGRLILRSPVETPMRTLSFIIALVSVLAGPSLAGSADRDLPGIGTFSYCGSPIRSPATEVAAALSQ